MYTVPWYGVGMLTKPGGMDTFDAVRSTSVAIRFQNVRFPLQTSTGSKGEFTLKGGFTPPIAKC